MQGDARLLYVSEHVLRLRSTPTLKGWQVLPVRIQRDALNHEKGTAIMRVYLHETVDCGAHVYDALDDYPAFCIETARRVIADEGSLGIV
jgi:hypothetical protein